MTGHFPKPEHQHASCIERTRSAAISKVEISGRKFGANQLMVLEAILQDHHALSAYALVERLGASGHKLQPVQVYRALEGLMEMGLVHHVHSRNGYIACTNLDDCKNPHFLLCSSCKRVAEIASDAVTSVISKTVSQSNFVLHHELVELTGLCPDCA